MPHHKSTAKRVRTSEKSRVRNLTVKRELRGAIRKVRETAKEESAPETLRNAHSKLDNAVRKGIIHPKTADRKKSRLAKLVNKEKPSSAS